MKRPEAKRLVSNDTPNLDDVIEHFEAEAEKIKAGLTARLRAHIALRKEQPKVETKKLARMKRRHRLPRGIFTRDDRDDWYNIRYTDQHGRLHREKASPLLEGAKAALEKRRTEVREGKFFPDKINQRTVLFGEMAKDYLAQVQQSKKRDKAHAEQRMPVLLDALKDAPIGELTPGKLDSVLAALAEKHGWTPATQNRYRSLLSGTFRHAVRNGKANSNPVRETAHLKENNQRVRYFREDENPDKDEQARLMKVVRSNSPEREAEILVALHSGMRRSEQYRTAQVPDGGLKWEHINFRAGVIRLPRTKAGKARDIPMNSVLRETLRSIPQQIDSPYVFDGTDPGKWFGKAIRAAKVKDFHWHDLRHTFASRLAMAGVPMRHIAELLGHSEIQTTMRYAHLQPGHLADAVERLATPKGVENEGQTDTATDTGVFEASEKAG